MNEALTLSVRQRDGVPEHDQYMLAAQRGNAPLEIPRSISHAGALGRSVSFAQLIATWASTSSERRILTSLPADGRDDLDRFVSRIHGLSAAYYADRITAEDGKTNLRQLLLEAATPRIRAMGDRKFADAARGPLTEFVFVHRAHRQFHSVAYRHEPTTADLMDPQRHGELIVTPREMNALVVNVLREQVRSKDFRRIAPLLDRRDFPLGHLLHETFRNTAEHAYLDLDGRIPLKGLRCILIAARQTQPDELYPSALVSAEHPHTDQYFELLRDRASRGRRHLVHILEISVLDTGPGLIATIASHLDANAGDSDRVAQCFRDHVSSKRGPNSGLGLGRVLSHVSALDGFLRVRTSTTEAFFSSLSDTRGSQPAPHVVGNLVKATGTALTIAVPLEL